MENYNSGFENPFVTPEIKKKDSDKEKSKESKKSSRFLPEKRQDDAKKIGETLEKSPLFKREKPDTAEADLDKKAELKHLKDASPVDEESAPTESLGEQERAEVTQELAAARRDELAAEEASAPDDEIAAEAARGIEAAEAFLEEVIKTGDVEAASQAVATEFDIELIDEAVPASLEDTVDHPIELSEEGEIPLLSVEPSKDESDNETSYVAPIPQAGSGSGGSGSGSGSGAGTGSGAGSGSGTPGGRGPMPPFGAGYGGPAGPGAPRPSSGAMRFNALYNPNVYTIADMDEAYRSGTSTGLVVGGIIGYLIGRRRGRIKTEKRLLPVQKRLEKQVKGIQEQLYAREMEIRQLAAKHAATVRQAKVERSNVEPARGVAAPERAKRVISETRLGLEKPLQAERLGKVIVKAEASANIAPELRKIAPEQVKSMSRQEILNVSEKVFVEGSSLRQMYEGHLLGEQGLRRVVTEYLRGHDVQQAIKQELVEREIDFERDPILRDKAYREMQQKRGGGGSGLQQLLQKAGVDASKGDQLSQVVEQLKAQQQESLERESRQRKIVDTAMITVIIILACIVTAILFSK